VVVVGNEAWISGVITHGRWTDADTGEVDDLAGEPVSTRVKDNGRSALDPTDQIGYSWIGVGWADSCTEQADDDLLDMPDGQVTVH
jgi:hypothetical protein